MTGKPTLQDLAESLEEMIRLQEKLIEKYRVMLRHVQMRIEKGFTTLK